MNASSRIYVAGHRGMVGAAILRRMAELELPAPIIADRDELENIYTELDRIGSHKDGLGGGAGDEFDFFADEARQHFVGIR